MIDFGARRCWWCNRHLVAEPSIIGEATAHCESPGCHWCRSCEMKRRDGKALPLAKS